MTPERRMALTIRMTELNVELRVLREELLERGQLLEKMNRELAALNEVATKRVAAIKTEIAQIKEEADNAID